MWLVALPSPIIEYPSKRNAPPMLLSTAATVIRRVSFILLLLWITATSRIVAAMSRPTPSESSARRDNNHQLRVLLLRHGQTDANANGIIQGSSDYSRLTNVGRQQAAQAVVALLQSDSDDSSISNVYISPLTRAQETLQEVMMQGENHLLQQLPPAETLLDLREIDFYDWEGRDKAYLQQQFPDAWKAWEEGNPDDLIVCDSSNDSSSTTLSMALKPLWD